MFEKDAEEYETKAECVEINDYGQKVYGTPHIEEAYQKGAEFGYNTANEWHFVKDGDLPKGEEVVVFIWHPEKRCAKCGAMIAGTMSFKVREEEEND